MGPEAYFSEQLRTAFKPYMYKQVIAFRIETSHTFPGCPDWIVLFKGGNYLFLELKAYDNGLTRAQKIVLPAMERLGIPIKLLTKKRRHIIITSVGKENCQEFANTKDLVENLIKEYGNE